MAVLIIKVMKYDLTDLVGELEDRPDCTNCCDTGTYYNNNDVEEFCDCDSGNAREFNHDFANDEFELVEGDFGTWGEE